MHESAPDDAGCAAAASDLDAHGGAASTQAAVVERLSRHGTQVAPGAPPRRSRLQRLQGDSDGAAPERSSLTPAMRKRYLKELLLSNATHGGLSNVLTSPTPGGAPPERDATWALDPTEHAWMLCAVEGSYDTILEFISEDPQLLTRRDFVSGYSVLHWLAKRGQDETLLRLLRYAEGAGIPVNVDARGSGGLTPLHVASMHGRYMVVKLLVGAFGASVDAMDHGGRRAWQYLRGDAPREMRELLGTWDEEHICGGRAPDANQNCNNSASAEGAAAATAAAWPCDAADGAAAGGGSDAADYLDRGKRAGGWRFGSLRKLLPSFSFLGSKS